MGNPRGTFTRAAALLGAATLAVGSAGCSGSTDANPASSTTTAGLATRTTSGAPTSAVGSNEFDVIANMPVEARQHTNAGAQAFARYYIHAFGQLCMRPAAGEFTKLSVTKCTGCRQLEKDLQSLVAEGSHVDAQHWITKNVSEPEVDASTVSMVKTVSLVESQPGTVVDARGSSIRKLPSGKQDLVTLHLTWADGRWLVEDYAEQVFSPATR